MAYDEKTAELANLETVVVPELLAALETAIDAFVDDSMDFDVPEQYGSAEEYVKAIYAEYESLRTPR